MEGKRDSLFLKQYGPYVLVLAVAAFLRFYFIQYPLDLPSSTQTLGYNGIDEGIHLMAGRLASDGWSMYVDVNPQQGPFVMMLYTIISGDVIQARVITALVSLIGVGAVMMIGKDIGGKWTGVISGILLLANYEFLKESRHASPDLFASVFLILGILFIIKYLKMRKYRNMTFIQRSSLMILSGMMLSISVMSKLFVIVAVFGVGLYMLIPLLRSWKEKSSERIDDLTDLVVLVVAVLAGTLILMSIFGFGNTFKGIFLDNLHRPSQSFSDKIAGFSDFALFTAFPLVIGTWWAVKKRDDGMVRLMSLWTYPMLLMFLLQSLTWVHYYILVIPPLCILAALPLGSFLERKGPDDGMAFERIFKIYNKKRSVQAVKVLMILFIIYTVISTGFSAATVFYARKPIEEIIADDVMELTEAEDMVLCGDPLIALLADRDQPPEATNLAKIRYPELTSDELIEITIDHDVRLVVFSYHLSTFDTYYQWVSQNWTFYRAYERPDVVYEEWKDPSEGYFLLYTI